MKPIWYFVGLILFIMGIIIMFSGIYYFDSDSVHKSVLSELHPNIWWGAIMVIIGIVYILRNRKVVVE